MPAAVSRSRPRRRAAHRALAHTGVDGHERVAGEDADQVRVPAHADVLPEERQGHGIERAPHFNVAIGVDSALAAGEEGK
jgi:hypothetical protein